MRCLVTGGAGFIGSALARTLVERGAAVRVLDNLVTGFEEQIPAGVDFVRADLLDLDAVARACEGIDIVFHQAAIRSVPKSVDNPLVTNEANVTGTLHVLVAAEGAGVEKVVYASSSSVYGDTGDAFNHEDTIPSPRSPYAVSKLTGEHYCRVWTYLGRMPTVSLRYFNVFGPGQHPESKYSAVFPAFISALRAGVAPEVHWDGEQSRDFTYIDDVVAANLRAAEAEERADGQVINVGGGRPRTVNEVLTSVSDALGTWIDPVHVERRPGDVRHTRADITKAGDVLGWEPEADWGPAVKATVDWFATGGP
ncbi:MAG: NAD-dependent epimerase/dehydratase family protein [Actinomycetota bacterium]